MEGKSFLESWKDYTIRDKILFGSSILPWFVSFIYALFWTPIIGWFLRDFSLNDGIFSLVDRAEGCDDFWDCPMVTYIINPFWLLLSSISIVIYGFYLFMEAPSTSPSALFRTSFILTFAAISQIIIFIFSLLWGDLGDCFRGINWINGTSHDVDMGGLLAPSIIPFTYLYIPNLIAIVALAYYSRIKNVEENADFIETKLETNTSDEESVSSAHSPVKQSHVFLVITVVGGMFGLDKAYKGDYVLAVLKLLTLGGLWIWQLYDIYVAAGEAGRSWSLDSGSSRITEKHVILITAIVGGHIGLDRAYKGDGVTGVFKLLTLGGLGIWWLVDVYVAAKEAGKSW